MMCLFFILGTVFSVHIMQKAVAEYQWYNPQEDDEEIMGKMVDAQFLLVYGDLKPIVSCYVAGKEQRYTYHVQIAGSCFSIGKEVTLHLSKRNGLVYVKKDLKKYLIYNIAMAAFFVVMDILIIFVPIIVLSFTMK